MAKARVARIVEMSNEQPQGAVQGVILGLDNHEEVSRLAYEFWIHRGCPVGSPEVDWYRAEEELKKETVLVAVTE